MAALIWAVGFKKSWQPENESIKIPFSSRQGDDGGSSFVHSKVRSLDKLPKGLSLLDKKKKLTSVEKVFPGLTIENAKDYLQELQENPGKWADYRELFFISWGLLKAEDALAYLQEHGGSSQTALMTLVLEGWSRHSQNEVTRWLFSFQEGREKYLLVDGALRGMSHLEFAQKAEWLEQFPMNRYAAKTISNFIDQWIAEDAEMAIDWLVKFPDSETRSHMAKQVFSQWSKRDIPTVGEQLNKMESGQVKDHAIGAFVKYFVHFEPSTAKEWAEKIEDIELREQIFAHYIPQEN